MKGQIMTGSCSVTLCILLNEYFIMCKSIWLKRAFFSGRKIKKFWNLQLMKQKLQCQRIWKYSLEHKLERLRYINRSCICLLIVKSLLLWCMHWALTRKGYQTEFFLILQVSNKNYLVHGQWQLEAYPTFSYVLLSETLWPSESCCV